MTKLNTKVLKTMLTFTQEQLHVFCSSMMSNYYEADEIIEIPGSFIYGKGDIPVLLVAHLDTVYSAPPTEDEIFHDTKRNVLWSPAGIGGDCRAGVFSIIDILTKDFKPHVIFTWDEEVGCIGAKNAVDLFHPKDINFAIELDRRGFNEAVYYDLDHQDFESYINSFGFSTQWGSYTDISHLCPGWGFAGVNLSSGYTNEHSDREMIWIDEIASTQYKVIEILMDQMENPEFFCWKEAPSWNGRNKFYFGAQVEGEDEEGTFIDESGMFYCNGCHTTKEVIYQSSNKLYCDDCHEIIIYNNQFTGNGSSEHFFGEEFSLDNGSDSGKCPYCGEETFYNPDLGFYCSMYCKNRKLAY